MFSFLCELILSCTLAAPGAKPVDELAYGTVLYEYFQEDYSAALVNTLVAEERGYTGEGLHSAQVSYRFELAKGSFAFSDGMYGYARDVFAAVPAEELTDIDRMRLSFHLAREYHRRGEWQPLGDSLTEIDLGKTWLGRLRFHPEVEYMRAEHALSSRNFAGAEEALARLPADEPLALYGFYNLGIAYREVGNLDLARFAFQRIAQTPAPSEEAFDLIQRSRLALAYIARAQDAPADAESVLGDLPGSGRYRDMALAAYGTLAMDREDYELAARIWLTLKEQEYWTASTATARIGFPVALEKLASTQLALQHYRDAEQGFSARLVSLDTLNKQAVDPAWVRGLLSTFSDPERDKKTMGAIVGQWQEDLGHTDWLEWLAGEEVHRVLVEWRELGEMRRWLERLPDEVAALETVSHEQRRRSLEARSLLLDDGLVAQRDQLRAQDALLRDTIHQLAQAPATPDMSWLEPLASDDEREALTNLFAMRDKVIRGMNKKDKAKWLPRIDRMIGVLFYQVANEQAGRLQVLRRTLSESTAVLADLDARITRVSNAESQFVAGIETDFLAFRDRASELIAQVDSAVVQREEMLAQELRDGMRRERRQVEQYLLVTRIAIARATDQLALDVESGGTDQASVAVGGAQ